MRNDSARKIRETLRIQRQKHHRYVGKPPFGTTRNEDGHLVPVEADRLLEPYDEQDDTALQRAELEEERQRLIKAYRREIISLDDLEREIADIDDALRELDKAEQEKPPSIVLPPSLFQAIRERDPEDRRRLYQMLLQRVDYDLDEHCVTRFEPQPWAEQYFKA